MQRNFDISKMNVRFKVKNTTIDEGGLSQVVKEDDRERREMRNIKSRLAKIAQLEVYRKLQFRKELEKLEERKRDEEEQERRKASVARRRYQRIQEQKRVVSDFKAKKQIELEEKTRIEEEQRAKEETKRKKYFDSQKRRLEERQIDAYE